MMTSTITQFGPSLVFTSLVEMMMAHYICVVLFFLNTPPECTILAVSKFLSMKSELKR